MSDDHDFKSVRKNFFLINVIVFGLAYADPPLQDITIANVKIPLSEFEIYIAFAIAYFYFAYRFYQEYLEQVKIVDQNFLNHFWNILPDKHFQLYQSVHQKIYQSATNLIGSGKLWSAFDKSKISLKRKDKNILEVSMSRLDTINNSNRDLKSGIQEIEKIREEIYIQELQPHYGKERKRYLRTNRDYLVLFSPVLFAIITVLIVGLRLIINFWPKISALFV
ncbi:hypothetical protein [Ekhidna sp.]|uniref:hypothetical protein n=1 Tax=Ekhidna sp. TaxID=2608089 RepID=UPI003297275B